MKNINYLLLLLIGVSVFTCFSCNKNDDEPRFKMSFQAPFQMQAGLAPYTVETHYFVINDLSSGFRSQLSTRSLTEGDIIDIKPLSCRLVRPFADGDYDFLFNVSVQIVNPNDPDDWKEIAYRDNIQTGTNATLDLFPTLVNVKEYVKESTFTIRVRADLFQSTTTFIDNRLEFDFEAFY